MIKTNPKQQGIALIQILLISTIITIIAMHFTQSAREQAAIAFAYQKRVDAQLLLKEAQSRLIFKLLTVNHQRDLSNGESIQSLWNFYGEPFRLEENIEVTLQDHRGLLTTHLMGDPLWLKWLESKGVPNGKAQQLLWRITDWQDHDRNHANNIGQETASLPNGVAVANRRVTFYSELEWLLYDYPELFSELSELVMFQVRGGFNPLVSPPEILQLLFDETTTQEILRRREAAELTASQLRVLFENAEEESMYNYSPGNVIRMEVSVTSGEVNLTETMVVKIQPENLTPVQVLYRY